MYYLLNKDHIIAELIPKTGSEFSDNTLFELHAQYGNLPIGFSDINSWLDGRKASKHNAHLKSIMKQMGCDDNEGFIRMTHVVSINDTFWIKSDKESICWNDISLYRNQFSEVVSKLAFEGVGLYDTILSSSSPELACDGSFRKCFRKENTIGECGSDIFLYKRGHELGLGLEPYCESMASEIARYISTDHAIKYDTVLLHNKLASKCNLFTNEELGYASFAKVADIKRSNLQDVFDYFYNIGSEQSFREMLVTDSLIFNQDRHAGNYGVLFNNDTLEIKGMAPIFDLNLAMLPYVEKEEFLNIGDKLFEYAPKLGDDFTRIGQMGMNDLIRDRVKDLKDFSFSFRGDDQFLAKRVEQLECIVRKQATAILSKEKLYTKDVFFSEKAANLQDQKERAEKAESIMSGFGQRIAEMYLPDDVMISECASTDTVQYFVENMDCIMRIDFLAGKICIEENAKEISSSKLKEKDRDFWKVCENVKKVLHDYLKEIQKTAMFPELEKKKEREEYER